MARLKAEPGQVVETVTQQRVITEDSKQKLDDGEELDGSVFEIVARLSPDEANDWILYVYRDAPERVKGYITKLAPPFDEETIKTNFGGGQYRLLLKKGQEIRKRTIFDVPGEPKTEIVPSTVAPAGGGGVTKSDLVQAMEIMQRANPQAMSADLMKAAFMNALDIQKAAASSNVIGPLQLMEMMKHMKDIAGPAALPAATPEWMQPLIAAAIPAFVTLIGKMLEPKDMIGQFTEAARAMETIKGLGGGGGTPKTDYVAELIRNGPQLLGKASDLMGEMRRATELRIAAHTPPPHTGPVLIPPSPGLHTPPPQVETIMPSPRATGGAPIVTPPPAAQPQIQMPSTEQSIEAGQPDPHWVLRKVAEMIAANQEPGFVLDFLEESLPELVAAMRMLTIDAIRAHISQIPEMQPVLGLAHFDEFMKNFYTKLHEQVPEPMAN